MAHLTMNYFSNALMREVTIDVLLPVDQTDIFKRTYPEIKPFKTLYLLHGIFGHRQDWIHNTNLIRYVKDYQLAVVFPSGENSMYADYKSMGVDYSKFIGEELVEMTRRSFFLSKKREETFIAGLSMGGLGALKNGLDYRETFSLIGSFSGAVPKVSELEERKFPKNLMGLDYGFLANEPISQFDIYEKIENSLPLPELYIACGSEDFLIESNRAFHAFLEAKKINHVYLEKPGVHDWVFWDDAILDFINYLAKTNRI